MNVQRTLIAVDGSPLAAHAADVGFDLARSLGADAAVIHVVDRTAAFAPESGRAASELMALAEKDGRNLLAHAIKRSRLPTRPTEFLCRRKPSTEILNIANEWGANIIIIGSHGRGGVTRLLLGGVAEAVVRGARSPVLVVRPSSS